MQEYMRLFKDGRSLLSMIQTTLKSDYAFYKVAVKFCEIFACLTCKQYETERQEKLLSVQQSYK
jgi:hypothetical protein